MKSVTFSAVLVLLSALSSMAHATTVSAIKDAYIHNRTAGDPVGNTVVMLPPFTSSSYSVYAYIGFDISDFQAQGDPAVLASFELAGFGSRSSLPLAIHGLNDAQAQDWSETTIDWSNAPGITSDSIDPLATTELFSGPVSYSNNAWIEFDGAALVDFINSDTDGLVTLILSQPVQTNNNHAFSSRESSGNPSIGSPGDYAPQLTVSEVPLPGAFWLFLSGVVGLVSCIRKSR